MILKKDLALKEGNYTQNISLKEVDSVYRSVVHLQQDMNENFLNADKTTEMQNSNRKIFFFPKELRAVWGSFWLNQLANLSPYSKSIISSCDSHSVVSDSFWDPTDCSLPGSSVCGILQAILEWVAISSSRGSSPPRNWSWVSCIAGRFFTI